MRFALMAAFLVALPLATFVACGSDETIETDQGTVSVDRDDDTMTVTGGGENKFEMKTGKKVELPSDFPGDVPVFPDSTLVTSVSAADGLMLSSQSTASPDDVLAFYKKELAGGGWTTDAEMNVGGQRMISFSKGDRQVTITASGDEGQTQITLTVGR